MWNGTEQKMEEIIPPAPEVDPDAENPDGDEAEEGEKPEEEAEE